MNKHNKKPFIFLFFILCLFGITAIVMWLWNMLLPEIIGVKNITYWQAMGILVLSKILFGGFGGRCGRGKKIGWNKEIFCENSPENSSPENHKFKEEFKKRFQSRFCK